MLFPSTAAAAADSSSAARPKGQTRVGRARQAHRRSLPSGPGFSALRRLSPHECLSVVIILLLDPWVAILASFHRPDQASIACLPYSSLVASFSLPWSIRLESLSSSLFARSYNAAAPRPLCLLPLYWSLLVGCSVASCYPLTFFLVHFTFDVRVQWLSYRRRFLPTLFSLGESFRNMSSHFKNNQTVTCRHRYERVVAE